MKIGLYSPFLADNIGGGERYLLTVAECLLPRHQVDMIIASGKKLDLKRLKQHFINTFNLKLDKLNLVTGPFGPGRSSRDRSRFTKQYDVFYYMTDGSFFISRAKLNALHFMIPFNQPPSFWQRLKLNSWQVKTSNSFFTKKALERIWKINIDYVHWGAVKSQDFQPLPKKNIILNVGRFFSPQGNKHCKKQHFLVKSFIKMCCSGLKNWRLVLNGPVDRGQDNQAYFEKVKKLARGYPVIFHTQGNFQQLQQNYGQAKIYWHATGYGVDENKNPQAVEHLGMSTVEAMSAASVPIVIKKGGQPEIVTHGINGLLWSSQKELIAQTQAVIANQALWQKLSRQAKIRARDFSPQKFCQVTKEIFQL